MRGAAEAAAGRPWGFAAAVPWRGLLLALAQLAALAASENSCSDERATLVRLDGPKVVQSGQHSKDQQALHWSFDAPPSDLRIAVTPVDHTMDPDIALYVRTSKAEGEQKEGAVLDECRLVTRAQDYGGDLLTVRYNATRPSSAMRYFLRVYCRSANCSYHVAFTLGNGSDVSEEIRIGETKSGVAYRGVPLHFFFDCAGECKTAAEQGTNQRLTISAWPRDATSVHHLTLLVRKGSEPSTALNEHLQATRGWFSGEVVGTDAEAGRFYITVLKRHGRVPMPFVLSVRLPESKQKIPLNRPFFGAVGRNQVAWYSFKVDDPSTDIEVYLTKLDGDPDMSMSHSEVHSHPTPLAAQWHSRKVGDDEIVVAPDDPKRKTHPTGWFNVGVHGFKHTSFSIIVLAEPHVNKEELAKEPGSVIDWTELWLGLPQTLSAGPGRAGNFLFFSQLATPRLFLQLETLEGKRPDACMATCGSDPHDCAYLSPLGAAAAGPSSAVSTCEAAKMLGANGDTQAVVKAPCSSCWYSILVTNEAGDKNRTRFRVLLGAEGRAHPLVAGEAFRGHVDAKDAAVLLVYDISAEELKNRTKANSTLRMVMTTIYGDPMFAVHSGAEDGPLLFASNASGREFFALSFGGGDKASTYYIVVWANSKHAQFRMQVSWDVTAASLPLVDQGGGSLKGLGLPVLREGKALSGMMQGRQPTLYLYEPVSGGKPRPDIRVGLRADRGHGLRLFAVPVRTGKDHSASAVRSALLETHEAVARGVQSAGWVSKRGSSVLIIPSSDPRYVEPGSGHLYGISVWRLKGNTSVATFSIEVSTDDTILELPSTGSPLPGVVRAGQYSRYRIVVAESGRHLAIMLKAVTGDADLYLGLNASVGRSSKITSSSLYGSDTIFLPAFGAVNAQHCSAQVIKEKGECVYFVAVLGSSQYSEFELSAAVPEGAPLQLGPNTDAMVLVPPGGHQYLALQLLPDAAGKNVALQVQTLRGALASLNVKVLRTSLAKHPDEQLTKLSAKTADVVGKQYASVWGARLGVEAVEKLCQAAAVDYGCSAFVSLQSKKGFVGKATFATSAVGAEAGASVVSTGAAKGEVLLLEAGVPARGSLRSKDEVLVYGFYVQDAKADLAVTLTPLTKCAPVLQLEFPRAGEGAERQILTLHMDQRLGFVSSRVPITDERFRTGLYYLWVRQLEAARCDFDLRAQQEVSSSVADLASLGQAAPTSLLLGAPVFASGDRARYFLFTSLIDKAEDAARREQLEVRITALTGELQVAVAVLNSTTSKNVSKGDLLAGAFRDIQPVAPEASGGTPRIFACRLRERCGVALACQLLVRVRSARPGRFADYLAAATDSSGQRPEALLPSVPVRGCAGAGCPAGKGGSAQYQLLVNNPSARTFVRLSCQGPDREAACGHVLLSADARPAMPESMAGRTYQPKPSVAKGELELEVAAPVGAESPGQCHAPCVLLVRVEAQPGFAGAANYSLVAGSKGGYTLLMDGSEPVTAVAKPSEPAYFLFDSRRASPLLTLSVTVPYDIMDPGMELVSVYVLDCDAFSTLNNSKGMRPPTPGKLEEASVLPSAENYKYRAIPSSRGQLVTFVSRGPSETESINEGRHCYYRIAVVSNRLQPVEFAIRGFDWHPGASLLVGEPLEGLADRKHAFSFQLEGSVAANPNTGKPHVVLSMEVCSGQTELRTAARPREGAGREQVQQSLVVKGGLPPTLVPLEENRWLEVSSTKGRLSSYVLTAEDPSKRTWLQPVPSSELVLTQEPDGQSYTLSWPEARLFGVGQPQEGAVGDGEPVAVYEVFYGRADASLGNTSSACGLYFDYRFKRSKRILAKHERSAKITGITPGHIYMFNVVARNSRTGHSVAYIEQRRFIFPEAFKQGTGGAGGPGRSQFWDEVGPVFAIGVSVGIFLCVRPFCKGSRPLWRQFEMELPSWPRGARDYRASSYSSSSVGTYAPPSVVGQAHYSQIR